MPRGASTLARAVAAIRPPHALVRVFVLLGAAALLSACRVDASVDVVVGDDGAGQVRVSVGFDEEALARGAICDSTMRGPPGGPSPDHRKKSTAAPSGLLWVRATKDFSNSEQFTAIMNEIGGANGIFRDFRLVRTTGFATVTLTDDRDDRRRAWPRVVQ